MLVADLMTRNTTAIRADQTLAEAAQAMWDRDCGALPVLHADGSRVVGMITDRDICMATWSRNAPPSALQVVDAMSQNIVHCSEQDSITSAESLMVSAQIRRLPVVDDQARLVGVLSLADIARATQGPRLAPDPSGDGIAKTLAGICKAHVTTEALRSQALS
jgi:CBS domain-containing protein